MAFDDFEVEVGVGAESRYPVRVLDSPTGEARETMEFPFDASGVGVAVQGVENEMLRARSRSRRMPSARHRAAEAFGSELFDALFTGSVLLRWEMSLEQARTRGRGLRLKLRVDDPMLAGVPWEFLYDRNRGEFLSLSGSTPVVRYLHLRDPRHELGVQLPLRVLGMISSPTDLPALDVDRERSLLDQAIAPLAERGVVEIEWLDGGGWRELHRAMLDGQWHVLHFIGHGGFDDDIDEGVVALERGDGRARTVDATRLGRFLADHRTLRLVVLNSCEGARSGGRDIFSSTSSILVRRGIPAVVAMQFEIEDQAAVEFAGSFYGFIGSGMAVDRAVTEARKALSMRPGLEWAIPALHMHAADGHLFDIDAVASAKRPPDSASNRGPPPRPVTRPTIDAGWGIQVAATNHAASGGLAEAGQRGRRSARTGRPIR